MRSASTGKLGRPLDENDTPTSMPRYGNDDLKIRDMVASDVPLVQSYWMELTQSDIARMSVNPQKISIKARQVENYLELAGTEYRDRTIDALMWELNGKPIGVSTLRHILFGDSAEIHLHIIDPLLRRSGYGHRFFALSLEEYFRRFELRLIVCEPSAQNPAPNRLLQKLGFTVARTYVTHPSEVSVEHEVNRYEITPAQLEPRQGW